MKVKHENFSKLATYVNQIWLPVLSSVSPLLSSPLKKYSSVQADCFRDIASESSDQEKKGKHFLGNRFLVLWIWGWLVFCMDRRVWFLGGSFSWVAGVTNSVSYPGLFCLRALCPWLRTYLYLSSQPTDTSHSSQGDELWGWEWTRANPRQWCRVNRASVLLRTEAEIVTHSMLFTILIRSSLS